MSTTTAPAGVSPLTLSAINASAIHAQVKHGDHAPSNPAMSDSERLAILVEEVGEVAHVLTHDAEGDPSVRRTHLEGEVLQIAAVAAMWIDALNPHANTRARS